MAPYRDKYRGHTIDFWEKSFRIDDGPVFMFGSNKPEAVFDLIDSIERVTKREIRIALGAK